MDPDEVRTWIAGITGALVGVLLLLIAAIFAFWPGPIAPTDRLPLALLFGLAGIAVGLRVEPMLRAVRGT